MSVSANNGRVKLKQHIYIKSPIFNSPLHAGTSPCNYNRNVKLSLPGVEIISHQGFGSNDTNGETSRWCSVVTRYFLNLKIKEHTQLHPHLIHLNAVS